MRKIARSTVYNDITAPDKLKNINENNLELLEDFLVYLQSVDRSPATIKGYESDLKIMFVWNLENNKNKPFIEISKREFTRFQNHCINTWNWSPSRIKRVKSSISSLSNYIENVLDDDEYYENYKPIIRKIENPASVAIREKTVLPDEQVDYLLTALVNNKKYEQACLIALAAFSGMRKSELIQMLESYFTEDKINESGLWETPEIRTKGRGKIGKLLKKYIMYDFKPYLDLWLDERKRLGVDIDSLFVVRKKLNDEYIWVPRRNVDHWYKEFTEILNVDFYLHCMRHYTCTRLARLNLPNHIIQAFFGWDSAEMLKIYNDVKASDEFGKYFSKNGIKTVEKGSL